MKRLKQAFQLTDSGVKGLVWAVFTSFLSHFAFMLPIFVVMFFVQQTLEGTAESVMPYVWAALIIFGILMVILRINYDSLYTMTYRESQNLRFRLADVFKALPLSYFSRHDISDLSQTLMHDVSQIEHALSHAIPQGISMVLFLILMVILMFLSSPVMAWMIFVPIVLGVMLPLLSKTMQKRGTKAYFVKQREVAEGFQELIEMQPEIRNYGLIDDVSERMKQRLEEAERVHIRSELAQALPVSSAQAVQNLTLGLTVFLGTGALIRGEVSLLYLIGFILCAAKITDLVSAIYFNIAEILYIGSRVERLRELNETPLQQGEKADLQSFDIVLKDVGFSYKEDCPVLNGVSFTARQGEVTALVGPSGCGKTTVLRLISRLYDSQSGSITVDGREVTSLDTETLFENISIVFQEVMLFNLSVMENIRLGRRSATDEEVKEAARLAHCDEFIRNLPEGYDTVIGENGSRLSGGERQRISIARAILKNAQIILLDEISASLDVENEMKIQESLNVLLKGKTVVVITHRMRSVETADRIVVMNEGKVEAVGRHEELLKTSATYRTMVERSESAEQYVY